MCRKQIDHPVYLLLGPGAGTYHFILYFYSREIQSFQAFRIHQRAF